MGEPRIVFLVDSWTDRIEYPHNHVRPRRRYCDVFDGYGDYDDLSYSRREHVLY